MNDKNGCNGVGIHTKNDGSYWVNDARGIPLSRVCPDCKEYKLSRYRRDVLSDSNYQADEPIDE